MLKKPEFSLHLFGSGSFGKIEYELTNLAALPNIHAGDYIELRDFDMSYGNRDRAVVTKTVWQFQGGASKPVIRLNVHFREEKN
jgi:hypothetical protein